MPFFLNYKTLVCPMEDLLMWKGTTEWSKECTANFNEMLRWVFAQSNYTKDRALGS